MYVLYWIDWSVCATLASLSLLCKAWNRLAKLGARLSKRVSLLMTASCDEKMKRPSGGPLVLLSISCNAREETG